MITTRYGDAMKLINAIFFGALLITSTFSVMASSQNSHWSPDAHASLYRLLIENSGKLLSTNSVEWPDGRSAQVQYIKTKD